MNVWLQAIRPRTLTTALAPVLVGTAVAHHAGSVALVPALAALLGAVWIQIGTNLANDYYDYVKGADTADRLGPTRVTQAGLVSPERVKAAMWAAFAMAVAPGAYLVAVGGWPIVVIGVVSILSGIAYTGGPFPLGYNGLGDLFVFVFFGLVAVMGTAFVQGAGWAMLGVVAAVPVGLLATAVLVVNNLRDAQTDAKAGKRTLAVRWGERAARVEYSALIAASYMTTVVLMFMVRSHWALLPLVSLPLAVSVWRGVMADGGRALNPRLGETARLVAVFGALEALGLVLAA
jgi:1,4-dihydroxy-2-naphthoate octaprenyltransferase